VYTFIDPGAWSNAAASIGISLMVATFDSALFLEVIWTHFVELHVAGTCVLDHPAYDREHILSFTIQLLSTSEPQHTSMWLKFSFQFNSVMLME
jgi:hypothetical protein